MLPKYMESVAQEMQTKSARIRQGFLNHNPSAGENRESVVAEFLAGHLPKRFGVSTGLVISHEGSFSSQADILVVDDQNNAPLYPELTNELWPVEAIYALIEVKTRLDSTTLKDALTKCRKFKSLPRRFCETGDRLQKNRNTLFIIWAFETIKPINLKSHLLEELEKVPVGEQPDLIIVPDSLVAMSGTYLETAKIGEENSPYRRKLLTQHCGDLSSLLPQCVELGDFGENALLTWHIWFDSWLRRAGPRFTDPISYISPDEIFGRRV